MKLQRSFFLIVFALLTSLVSKAQDQLDLIDVQWYDVTVQVLDDTNYIAVDEYINIKFLKDGEGFYLDLASVSEGKGMKVNKLDNGSKPVKWKHSENRIWIEPKSMKANKSITLHINYSGFPRTGLIIGKNKFGDRTIFGDNWPNRAHEWVACIDHPADKATVHFTVIAPSKYQCIATGEMRSVSVRKSGRTIHSFESRDQLPTKVMVIGLAEFAIDTIQNEHDFPLDVWAYPQDSSKAFEYLQVSKEILDFFIEKIGPYPFEKLSNVQSTTQFGGMENAGNIFYDENAFVKEERIESLAAHEIAHQWFGNSASEADWQHIWLSEGFAVYMTNLYWESKYGSKEFNDRLIGEREKVINFAKKYNHPVVDTTYESLMKLLNPNSYQKGGWVLHMLRNEVGDSLFWKGVQEYYDTYKYGNATTQDLKTVMESVSDKDLSVFFDQWLYQSQHPTLRTVFNTREGFDVLTIFQRQNTHTFDVDLEVEFTYDDGSKEIKTFKIDKRMNVFKLSQDKFITAMKFDPNVKLLFEMLEQ